MNDCQDSSICKRFFTRLDWGAFWSATLVTFAVYFFTLGPSVGLEDSGELATAGAHLGVPHPPGYPFWSFCSWLFCKAFGWVTYMGHPTPAWCISLFSAVVGAFAAGFTAMLICRSSRDFLDDAGNDWLCFGGGVAGALTFALSPVEWSQSTIVEIYSLNAFFLMWVFLLSYRWMRRPSDKMLWVTAFVFGLGLTNYQVLVFAIVPLTLIIALRNITMFRDFALYLIPVLLCYQVLMIGDLGRSQTGMSSGVINKQVPVGITEKRYVDKLTVDSCFSHFHLAVTQPEDFKATAKSLRNKVRILLSRGDERNARLLMEELATFDAVDRYLPGLDAEVRKALENTRRESDGKVVSAPQSYELKASTDRCPSGIGIVISLIVLVGSLLASVYFRSRQKSAAAMRSVLFGGGAGAALMFLSGTLFTTVGTWEKISLDTAPLVEPWIYAVAGSLIAASVVAAVAAAIRTDDSGYPKLTVKGLYIAAGVAGALAIAVVLFSVPAAKDLAIFGDTRLYGYRGKPYPWLWSSSIFAVLIAALFALAAFMKRGLSFAIPVASFQTVIFILTCLGAMNGLTHPTSWWFWWPLAWNFVVLALACCVLPHGRSVAGAAFFAQLGFSFYAYMPIVSELRNPPMNWGYPRTWEGFKHSFTRGQYEAIGFKIPKPEVIWNYFEDVRVQFTDLLIPFALVPFAAGHWIVKKANRKAFWLWMVPAFVCFFLMSFLLIALANPKGDLQDNFIQKVKFISSHAMLALWIGYGLVFAAVFALRWLKVISRTVTIAIAAVMIAVSLAYPIVDNYCGNYLGLGVNEVAFKLGGSEQNGHTFGWQFGAYQLDGAKAINEQLVEDEEPLPDPDWPEPMEPFSIFFGGTDPGRFVPTYMIYSAEFRPDVYLITQNALADDTYMSVERDLYGDEIWIPSKEDCAEAFDIYVREVKSGKREANGDLQIQNGRVQVTGALGVMEINGILTEMMFKHDRLRHSFYVEESYVIPWMYPYLSPHGLIMKINAEKTPYDAKTAAKDQDLWDWYVRRLLDDPMYRRDFAGQKSFSKLRAAIAGLYIHQGRYREGAQAFREACLLYPASPEATFRYAQEYLLGFRKYDIFYELMDYTEYIDPNSTRTKRLRASVDRICRHFRDIEMLEAKFRTPSAKLTPAELLRLGCAYHGLGRTSDAAKLVRGLVGDFNGPNELKQIAAILLAAQLHDDAERCLGKYLKANPNGDAGAWLDLAKLQFRAQRRTAAVASVRQAYAINPELVQREVSADASLRAIYAEASREAAAQQPSRPAAGALWP